MRSVHGGGGQGGSVDGPSSTAPAGGHWRMEFRTAENGLANPRPTGCWLQGSWPGRARPDVDSWMGVARAVPEAKLYSCCSRRELLQVTTLTALRLAYNRLSALLLLHHRPSSTRKHLPLRHSVNSNPHTIISAVSRVPTFLFLFYARVLLEPRKEDARPRHGNRSLGVPLRRGTRAQGLCPPDSQR